jgi:DNA-binding GntR family transcriptional regulator
MTDTGNDTARDGQNVAIIYDRLRHEILAGQIPAGETSQAALARQLDVGRTPLREAIRMLQREGLVISEPNRRVRIADLSDVDAEDLSLMRIALESVAVRLTVSMLGSDGVAQLEGLMAQMEHYKRREDYPGYAGAHRAFHARLIAAAGERVTTMAAELFDHAERYRLAFAVRTLELWNARQAEHRAILDAAAADDPDATVLRLAEHYGSSAAMIFAGLGGNYAPDRLRATLIAVAPGSECSLENYTASSDKVASRRP